MNQSTMRVRELYVRNPLLQNVYMYDRGQNLAGVVAEREIKERDDE